MADTPIKDGETANQGDSQTTVTTTTAPAPAPAVQDNASAAEVERLRKEKEQSDLRIRQLENEKVAREKADQEAQQKQLEEQNEFKSLYEQEKAKREALDNERQEAETKQTLSIAEQAIFAEFDPSAIEVAKDAGLSLTEDSDEAKAALKTKLEKIQSKVVTGKMTPNNPGSLPEKNDRAELLPAMRAGNTEARDKAVGTLKSLDFMRAQAGYSQDK